jgi:retron-type reverse transcriptase
VKTPYARLRQIEVLDAAWVHVRANAQRSICSETRGEAQAFANDERRNLNRIQRQLQRGTFTFEPQRGVLIKKRGKGQRPIVIAPVESRIVQRALLEIIQAHPAIRSRLTQGFNFGGIVGRGFGVPAAVKKAWITSRTQPFYIRTDIRSFFTAVPRARALAKIEAVIDDAQFNALLKSATDVELMNVETMGSDVSLFPLFEEGVAQGSCLSPLLCNLLLSDFDEQMNDRGIVCIRYIDDFIIFAKSRAAAMKAFEAGALSLQRLGLDIYDPRLPDGAAKSAEGLVDAGFSFLGCEVYPDRVRPSKRNRDDLKAAVEEIFETALGAIRDPERAVRKRLTYSDALRTASLTVRGWGVLFRRRVDARP